MSKYKYLRAGAGRKPHPPIAMLKALILKELMQIPSRRKLAKFLKANEYWLRKCGFKSPPHHDNFSKFIKRLGEELFRRLFNSLIYQLKKLNVIKGEDIAVDSTLIKAYANPKENGRCSDADARWGHDVRGRWTFGYKVHLACDTDVELPLAFRVTAANVHDSVEYSKILKDLFHSEIKFKRILADAGYDSEKNRMTTQAYGAIPIIAINPRRHGKGYYDEDLMSPRYKKRSSIERVFSRLKEELCMNIIKVRGLWRVTVHVCISLIAMVCVAIAAIKTKNWKLLTSIGYFKY